MIMDDSLNSKQIQIEILKSQLDTFRKIWVDQCNATMRTSERIESIEKRISELLNT